MKKLLITIIIFFFCVSNIFAATFYVRTDAEDDFGDGSANDVANAFSLEAWETHLEASATAGDIYYVREGTYTLGVATAINTALDGDDTTGWISVIGFDSANDANPTLGTSNRDWANMPLIAAAANAFTFNNYWRIENLDITITENTGLGLGDYCFVRNVRVVQSNASADRNAISCGQRCTIIGNDLSATNGRGITIINECNVLLNYFHDSDIGVNNTHNSSAIVGNVFDTILTRGIVLGGTRINTLILSNTFYGANDADAIALYKDGTPGGEVVINNIFQDWYQGINQTTAPVTSILDYNSYFSNSNADVVNWTKGSNAQNADAGFTDAAGADFNIDATLDDLGSGFVNTNTTDHSEIGAVMYEETAGGAAGGRGVGWAIQ